MTARRIQCLVVGDKHCGKTKLLHTYAQKGPIDGHVPAIFDRYSTNVTVDGELISFIPCDSSGFEDYDRTRPAIYPQTDVFLVCFSLSDEASLKSAQKKWCPELRHHCGCHVPIVLVGGLAMANRVGAAKYLECSLVNGEGVEGVFEEAIRAALVKPVAKQHYCLIV